MKKIFEEIDRWVYENMDCVDWNMEEFCWMYNFWSWQESYDDDGNLLDEYRVITLKDLQNACDYAGIEFDCLNY